MGRRWGKTVLGGALILATASRGGRVAWTVPTYKNGRPLWRWMETTVSPLRQSRLCDVSRSERVIQFSGGGFLGIYSMDNEDSIRGDNFDLVVSDEAAMMSETAWTDAIQPTLADRGGDALLISTPRGRNWFWKEWVKGQDGAQSTQQSWTAPSSANPNPRIQLAAELARERMPERTYLQEWLAQFLEDGAGVFRGIDLAATAEMVSPVIPGTYVMGVDWGRSNDFTVLVVMDCWTKKIVEIDRFNQIGWSLQRGRVKALAERWRPTMILAEENSIGSPNIEALQAEGLPVRGFTTTNETKAEIIEHLALLIETNRISYPPIPELLAELQSFEMETLKSGRIRYGAPAGMHDDIVISLALAAWAGARDNEVTFGPGIYG